MLLVTAIAFASVGSRYFPTSITLTVILVMAGIQLILQLTSFMHLDRRSQIPILFMTAGLGFSAIIVVGIYLCEDNPPQSPVLNRQAHSAMIIPKITTWCTHPAGSTFKNG